MSGLLRNIIAFFTGLLAYGSKTVKDVHARGFQAAEVLVKMKFKKGGITVAPFSFLPVSFTSIPAKVQGLEPALAAR